MVKFILYYCVNKRHNLLRCKVLDKYEYGIKSDQIKKMVAKKDYKIATKIADTIDWSKVKSNSMLITVADAYEAVRAYDKAKQVLLCAYERTPMGRQLAYRLSILSIKLKDYADAEDFYRDFVVNSKGRVCVIISDAMRYEVGVTLFEQFKALFGVISATAIMSGAILLMTPLISSNPFLHFFCGVLIGFIVYSLVIYVFNIANFRDEIYAFIKKMEKK